MDSFRGPLRQAFQFERILLAADSESPITVNAVRLFMGSQLRIVQRAHDRHLECRPMVKLTATLLFDWRQVVPGTGIEPVTRGFSIRCSTN